MGQHADDFLYDVIDHESMVDEYVNGHLNLEEAFEYGMIDPLGNEDPNVTQAYGRAEMITPDNLMRQLKDIERLLDTQPVPEKKRRTKLNREAIINLYKESPTCNVCENEMSSNTGKFGKFYFFPNRCTGQPTVSDKYWQSIRQGGNNG